MFRKIFASFLILGNCTLYILLVTDHENSNENDRQEIIRGLDSLLVPRENAAFLSLGMSKWALNVSERLASSINGGPLFRIAGER